MSLFREVEKFLKKQAQLNEKSEKIIDIFLKEHAKTEICSVCEYIACNGAPKHTELINEFKEHYEKNVLKVEDIKSYLDVYNIHKDRMKEPNTKNISEN